MIYLTIFKWSNRGFLKYLPNILVMYTISRYVQSWAYTRPSSVDAYTIFCISFSSKEFFGHWLRLNLSLLATWILVVYNLACNIPLKPFQYNLFETIQEYSKVYNLSCHVYLEPFRYNPRVFWEWSRCIYMPNTKNALLRPFILKLLS